MSRLGIIHRYRRLIGTGVFIALVFLFSVEGAVAANSTVEGESLIAANPDDPMSYVTAAGYARDRGDLESAVEILERGRGRLAPSGDLLVTLGELYWQMNWPGDAIAAFRDAAKAVPDTPETCARLARAFAVAGEAVQGERICREYLARWSDQPLLYVALGENLEKLNDYPGAFAAYGRALELDENHAIAHSRRGRLFCLMGQYEAAAAACQKSLATDPDDALAHAYLSIACSELGRFWEAQIHAAAAEEAGMNMSAVWERIGKWDEESQPAP
jgi:predicted Zn-dependent protease